MRAQDECRSQTTDRYDATHFALHGLWPQPRSNVCCNVAAVDVAADKAGRWGGLPPVVLDLDTRTELDKVMPGAQ